ncbi:hypothetical protein J8273_2070 [Carpediemonas membranifera]|uniref:Uncharacterized protein n=1 Tax=Carpediemonas membranifera TaxID=201153 RepID=A0A8J6E1G9_9EUKA|nr:hypothetical protein J8273_2070 [Carpediemonas membranifera]|eukprot:KAG9396339.1 hypothetical protein J8273_2070 [Carpediemonas membranifera]
MQIDTQVRPEYPLLLDRLNAFDRQMERNAFVSNLYKETGDISSPRLAIESSKNASLLSNAVLAESIAAVASKQDSVDSLLSTLKDAITQTSAHPTLPAPEEVTWARMEAVLRGGQSMVWADLPEPPTAPVDATKAAEETTEGQGGYDEDMAMDSGKDEGGSDYSPGSEPDDDVDMGE